MKWHNTYSVDDHTLRYDVTNAMLSQLPIRIQYQLRGKITVDYNPNTILNYHQLIALGIQDCGPPAQKALAAAPNVANRSGMIVAAPVRPAALEARTVIRVASLPVSLRIAFFKAFARGLSGKRSNKL